MSAKECRARLTEPLPTESNITQVMSDFYRAINMKVEDLEQFLTTPESEMGVEQGHGEEQEGRHLCRRSA